MIAIGRKLQGNDMKLLALIYLGINEVEIETTWQEEEGRALHFNKEIVINLGFRTYGLVI